jgi:hypothetical protein
MFYVHHSTNPYLLFFVCVCVRAYSYIMIFCQMRTFCSIQWSMTVSSELGRIRFILNRSVASGVQRTFWFLNTLTLTYLDCYVCRAWTYCIRVWCARSVTCERHYGMFVVVGKRHYIICQVHRMLCLTYDLLGWIELHLNRLPTLPLSETRCLQ